MLHNIKIGCINWQVILRESLSDEGCRGKCYKDRNEIHITTDLPDSAQKETLMHEVLHACCHFVGITEEDKITEEEFCTRITPILRTVLKENPNLVLE